MALTADVVVIGGGVTGTSTAFHLAERGVRDVIVVDKGFVASGRHREELGLCAPALLHGRDVPDDPVLPRLLPALCRAHRRRVVRLPPDGLPPRRGRPDAPPDGGLGGAPALGGDRHPPRLARGDAGDRAAPPHRRPRGRLLRARLGLLQPGRDGAGVRAGGARARRARSWSTPRSWACSTEGSRVPRRAHERGRHPRPRASSTRPASGARGSARIAGVELPITVCRHKISLVSWPDEARAAAPDGLRLRHQHLYAPRAGGAHPGGRPRRRGVPRPRRSRPLQGRREPRRVDRRAGPRQPPLPRARPRAASPGATRAAST